MCSVTSTTPMHIKLVTQLLCSSCVMCFSCRPKPQLMNWFSVIHSQTTCSSLTGIKKQVNRIPRPMAHRKSWSTITIFMISIEVFSLLPSRFTASVSHKLVCGPKITLSFCFLSFKVGSTLRSYHMATSAYHLHVPHSTTVCG